MPENKLLSIILLSYFSQDRINSVFTKVAEVMEKENIPFEFIIIDDGSKDDSYKIACELEKKDVRVRAYQLSRNVTAHYAKFAGFSVCKGDCVTSIPDDFQMPLEVIVKMYRMGEKGHKIIIPFRASRKDGLIKDALSNLYYNIMNRISDVNFPKGGADGFLIDRELLDIFNERIHPINTSSTVEALRMGFDPVFIPFDRPQVKGKSRWTLRKRLKLAFDTILSSSSFPIKLITILGILSVFVSIIFIIAVMIIKIYSTRGLLGITIPGWTSSFILISFFSGLILFSLGIISAYIWLIYEEVKNRPGFIIKKKEHS